MMPPRPPITPSALLRQGLHQPAAPAAVPAGPAESAQAAPGSAPAGALDGVAARQPQLGEPSRKRKRDEEVDPSDTLPQEGPAAKRRLIDRGASASASTPAAAVGASGAPDDTAGGAGEPLEPEGDDSPVVDVGGPPPQSLVAEQEDAADEALAVHAEVAIVTDALGRTTRARYADVDMNINGSDERARLVFAQAGDGTAGVFTDVMAGGLVLVFSAPGHVALLHTLSRDQDLLDEAATARERFIEACGAAKVATTVVFSRVHLEEGLDFDSTGMGMAALAQVYGLALPPALAGDDAASKTWLQQTLLQNHAARAEAAATALQASALVEAPRGAVLARTSGGLELFTQGDEGPSARPA